MRALLYARVSTDQQAAEGTTSLDSQLDACRQRAQERGWEVVGEFSDVRTGATLDRAGLDVVRAWARDGRFDVLLANSQDRLSRLQTDTGILYTEFTKAGVQLVTVQEGSFETSPTGQFLRSAVAFSAELDRARRMEATSRGQRSKVERGSLLGSAPRAAHGYRYSEDRRRYLVDEQEAAVIRELFAGTIAGIGTRALAERLNQRGVATPYGTDERYHTRGLWTGQMVRRLLREQRYTGEAWGFSGTIELPSGTVPEIVSHEDWQKVQAILDGRALRPVHSEKSRHVWLRGGLVVCGVCGAGMVLAHKPNHSAYLKCTRANRYATDAVCAKPSPSITTDKLQRAVWPLVEAVLNRPELLWDRFTSEEQQAHDEEELINRQQQLAGVQARRTRLLRSLEVLDEVDLGDVRQRLTELNMESDELTQAVSGLERRIASRALQRERLSVWLAEEQTRIGEMDIAEKREAALRLGLRVRVFPATADERFVAEFGAVLPYADSFFDGLDFTDIEATDERRRITAELQAEAIARGEGAELIERVLEGSVSWQESLNHRRYTASSRRSVLL